MKKNELKSLVSKLVRCNISFPDLKFVAWKVLSEQLSQRTLGNSNLIAMRSPGIPPPFCKEKEGVACTLFLFSSVSTDHHVEFYYYTYVYGALEQNLNFLYQKCV